MNDEYSIDSPVLTLGDDGVYRWLYRMDMSENKSMLYMLMRIFAWICAGAFAFWVFLLAKNHNTDMLPRSFLIFLLITAAVEFLVWLGFTIARGVMKDTYDLRFEMSETEVVIYQSAENMERRKYGRRWHQSDLVSRAPFNSVLSVRAYPEWDMIDLGVIGGKFQVYARKKDFSAVLDYILEHVPERVRKSAG